MKIIYAIGVSDLEQVYGLDQQADGVLDPVDDRAQWGVHEERGRSSGLSSDERRFF